MVLPESVRYCIRVLEAGGYTAYAVGGCVRDHCLGLVPQDFDLCTSARPEDMERLFHGHSLVLAGKKHGTVGVIVDHQCVEITTYRTEGAYSDNRHPDWVRFVDRIEEDLSRRDFTINAMAYAPGAGYADPFGGREDLKNRVLRAVGDPEARFREDSLRILRGVRFAVKYHLEVEKNTREAMISLAPLMDNLARERVFSELCKLLPLVTAEDLGRFAPILCQVIPELAPTVGFDQHSPHHAYDVFTHTARVVGHVPGDLTLRWAALLHDIGKVPTFTRDATGRGHFYGHAPRGAEMAEEALRRLKAPRGLTEDVVTLIANHMTRTELTKKAVRRLLSRLGWENTERLLTLQRADMMSKGVEKEGNLQQFEVISQLLEEIRQEDACLTVRDLRINGHDLMTLGLRGPKIGKTLEALLNQVLDETLENNHEALMERAIQLTVDN